MRELKIDPELRNLLPPLTDDEYKQLEKNIVENGFDRNFPIMEWQGYIVDGHNRYDICKKHNITDYVVGTLAYETKEQVMEWMLDIQLGRRNLSPIQRIAITEKYRPIYEKQAKENQGTRNDLKNNITVNLPQSLSNSNENRNPTTAEKLASVAGVSEKTYRMGAKILNSDNEEVKEKVLSGEMSINAGYNKIREYTKQKENINNESTTTQLSTMQKESQKPIIENGVILIEEKTDDDKMMNDIARRMKSGQADLSKINNESELINIESIISENIRSSINYIYTNIQFDNFTKSDFNKLREVINEAKNKMDKLIKDMEELVNEE